ncbi:MAG: RsmD family RNA methyltransferase [Pirellulaceae bacterium]
MPKKKNNRTSPRDTPAGVRIIGGTLGGRNLHYSGDLRTRPMKDRLREAIFNLVGPRIKGMQAIDLFSGTGALGIEAVSRGATRAVLIERHFPTVGLIQQSINDLGLENQVAAIATDTFYWVEQGLETHLPLTANAPWLVFCSPPYDLYQTEAGNIESMLQQIGELAPRESILVVESDDRYDNQQLPWPGSWDIRNYPPAVVAMWIKPGGDPEEQ